jgi:uncharacterized SAM-binding protein YcdF (DUF218 family)
MFILSKLLSSLTHPLFWVALCWAAALLMPRSWRKTSMILSWGGLTLLGLLGVRAIPDALLRPLENRYPVPPAETIDQYVGIIVLGGAVGPADVYATRGQVPINDAAERMTVSVALLRQHPAFQLVFSGGEGRLITTGTSESEMARTFYREQGAEMSRVQFESRSRNTRENARYVEELLAQRCKEPWLLITSAAHMPRSMAEFQAIGCNVTPYPVDFRTGGGTPLREYSIGESLQSWAIAIHEWLGLWVYGLHAAPRLEP